MKKTEKILSTIIETIRPIEIIMAIINLSVIYAYSVTITSINLLPYDRPGAAVILLLLYIINVVVRNDESTHI